LTSGGLAGRELDDWLSPQRAPSAAGPESWSPCSDSCANAPNAALGERAASSSPKLSIGLVVVPLSTSSNQIATFT